MTATQPALPLDLDACERDALRAAYSRHPIKQRYTFESVLRIPALRICLRGLVTSQRRRHAANQEHA
jgi:hypothetical protein